MVINYLKDAVEFEGIYKNYFKYNLDGTLNGLPYLKHHLSNYFLYVTEDELFIGYCFNNDLKETTKNYPNNIAGFISAVEEMKTKNIN